MVDFNLTPEQQMYKETAKEFAEREIRPAAAAILQRGPEQSPWDILKPVYAKGVELGFTKILIPEEYGGLGGSCMDNVIVMEEFGAADLGIAASYFNVSTTSPIIILKGGNQQQRDKWLNALTSEPDHVLASASSEPNVAGADSFCPIPDPNIGLKSLARKQGDKYIINGSKAGFSTNAGAAKSFFVMARTDLTKPAFDSTSMFIIPADTPGLTVGTKNHLIGWKTAMHSEVYLDDVTVSEENRIGAEGANAGLFFMQTIPYLAAGLAATYVGLARAALDVAYAYAHERISWGQPIINHQAVALKLADMVADLEAARLMVWKLAWAADNNDPHAAGIISPAAKTFAVDVAIRNAERALKIMGSYGLSEDYAAGRFLNDAWVGDACDGTRDMLRLGIVNFLRMARGDLQPPGPPPA
ncbi:MAG: acyl-CoA dehydrogenase family protein [Halioglobus sp.]|nr:acyl-CoA dehydrogenase family protein [Halioglobus sp.]